MNANPPERQACIATSTRGSKFRTNARNAVEARSAIRNAAIGVTNPISNPIGGEPGAPTNARFEPRIRIASSHPARRIAPEMPALVAGDECGWVEGMVLDIFDLQVTCNMRVT